MLDLPGWTPVEHARRRRRLQSVSWLVAGVVIGVLGCLLVSGLAAVWPDADARDEEAFGASAFTPGVGKVAHADDPSAWEADIACAHAWAQAHPELILAEGDRACGWLRGQPAAPRDNAPEAFTLEAMESRYVAETTGLEIARVYPEARMVIAGNAWFELCWGSTDARVSLD